MHDCMFVVPISIIKTNKYLMVQYCPTLEQKQERVFHPINEAYMYELRQGILVIQYDEYAGDSWASLSQLPRLI